MARESKKIKENLNELVSTLLAPLGGVMTNRVGAITGELWLRTQMLKTRVKVWVAYAETDDYYLVTRSPVKLPRGTTLSHGEIHSLISNHLSTEPAELDEYENPKSTDLNTMVISEQTTPQETN